jgi:glycosyltransferase involved in cell wall biosynthesis
MIQSPRPDASAPYSPAMSVPRIALDATYSVGENLSGVGVYSRELLRVMAAGHPEQQFAFCYRPHRYLRSLGVTLPPNARRALLYEPLFPRSREFFHGLNQRVPGIRFRRTVSTFHDLFVLTGDYSTPEFRRRFAEQARRAAGESDAIIAVSAFTAHQVERLLGVERGRIHVVHHGVNHVALVEPMPRENIVLNVGAIQRRKNIERLVAAFERTPPDWRLVLAGSEGYGAQGILARIAASPRRGDIQMLGYVLDAELAEWYARARIFAFPSLDEGFGMPVLEAMAAGVPVIAANRAALPEVCGDAALMVDPESVEAIATAIGQLIRDPALAERLAQRGIKHARGFSWEKAASETWQVYQKLTG